jgi:hypothetical protein
MPRHTGRPRCARDRPPKSDTTRRARLVARPLALRTQFEAPDPADHLSGRRRERQIVRGARHGNVGIARITPQHPRLPVELPADDPAARPCGRIAWFVGAHAIAGGPGAAQRDAHAEPSRLGAGERHRTEQRARARIDAFAHAPLIECRSGVERRRGRQRDCDHQLDERESVAAPQVRADNLSVQSHRHCPPST